MSIVHENSKLHQKPVPAWIIPKLTKLRSRAREGRIVLRFNDPLIGAAFTLLTSGQASVVTDHIRKIHILTLTGEVIQ